MNDLRGHVSGENPVGASPCQPILSNAARTRRGQLLIRNRKGHSERYGGHFAVSKAIRDDLDGESFGVADRLFARLPVAHDTWQLEGLGNPAAVVFTIQLNGQLHLFITAVGYGPSQ